MALTTVVVSVPLTPAADDIQVTFGVPASTAGTLATPVGNVAALTVAATDPTYYTWRFDLSGITGPPATGNIVGATLTAEVEAVDPLDAGSAAIAAVYGVSVDTYTHADTVTPGAGCVVGGEGPARQNAGPLAGAMTYTLAYPVAEVGGYGIILAHNTNDVSDIGPTTFGEVTLTIEYDEDHSGLQRCVASDSCEILGAP